MHTHYNNFLFAINMFSGVCLCVCKIKSVGGFVFYLLKGHWKWVDGLLLESRCHSFFAQIILELPLVQVIDNLNNNNKNKDSYIRKKSLVNCLLLFSNSRFLWNFFYYVNLWPFFIEKCKRKVVVSSNNIRIQSFFSNNYNNNNI